VGLYRTRPRTRFTAVPRSRSRSVWTTLFCFISTIPSRTPLSRGRVLYKQTLKLVARKKRLYKYACRQSFGNKFYCFENFEAEFLSVRQGSTSTIKKFCQSLWRSPFNSSPKKYKIVVPCGGLSWVNYHKWGITITWMPIENRTAFLGLLNLLLHFRCWLQNHKYGCMHFNKLSALKGKKSSRMLQNFWVRFSFTPFRLS